MDKIKYIVIFTLMYFLIRFIYTIIFKYEKFTPAPSIPIISNISDVSGVLGTLYYLH